MFRATSTGAVTVRDPEPQLAPTLSSNSSRGHVRRAPVKPLVRHTLCQECGYMMISDRPENPSAMTALRVS